MAGPDASALVLYTNPMSRGRVARWALEEVGAPYETVVLDYATTLKAPAYLAVNPMGKVPAIVHGGRTVTETAAICAYLADAFPQAALAPLPDERADYYRWFFFTAGPMEAAITNAALKVDVAADQQRMTGYGTLARVLDTLEAQLAERPYLCGMRFTAADIYCGAQIAFGLHFGTIEPRDAFRAYADRVTARPAHGAAAGLDDALLSRPSEKLPEKLPETLPEA